MVGVCTEEPEFLTDSETYGEYLASFLEKYSGSSHLTAQKILKDWQDRKLYWSHGSLPARVLLLFIGFSLFLPEVRSQKTKTLQNGISVRPHFHRHAA